MKNLKAINTRESGNKTKTFLREKRVPSTNLERVLGFTSLAFGLAAGGVAESIKRTVRGEKDKAKLSSLMMTKSNANRIVNTLCRMRGAALKIGQMISLQQEFLPEDIQDIFAKLRDQADVMPRKNIESIMKKEFGNDWSKIFVDFDFKPIAAASVSQVHKAKLLGKTDVAVKIQFRGVAKATDNDLESLNQINKRFDLFPRGLYIDEVIKAARIELKREVDFSLEAKQQRRMKNLINNENVFKDINVPEIYEKYSSKNILVTDLVNGKPLDKLMHLSQKERNKIASNFLRICLKELFVFRFMQTDPNQSNFLYDENTGMMHLIDFGASREYSRWFTENYLVMVHACSQRNSVEVLKRSKILGFTTGDETKRLEKLHLEAAFMLGDPFNFDGNYDFRNNKIIRKFSNLSKEIMRDRLTPPPIEAYTLHRKLSGCFLTCSKLGAVIPCREYFLDIWNNYNWEKSVIDV